MLAHRWAILWMMATHPTPARRREARRMVTEKAEAAVEGAMAMQRELLRQAYSVWVRAWGAGVTRRSLARAGARLVESGAAPARRRLRANARRLRRRKRI
ncbi:MAG: hypothetical protein ACJ79E_09475 [Anaeromyxobacteraceae bacterium]